MDFYTPTLLIIRQVKKKSHQLKGSIKVSNKKFTTLPHTLVPYKNWGRTPSRTSKRPARRTSGLSGIDKHYLKLGPCLHNKPLMRISRTAQLYTPAGFVHKFWRCHNREFYLNTAFTKQLYLNCVIKGLKHQISQGNIAIHAYCAMTNHFHHLIHYRNGSQWLSSFMRYSHGLFGAKYNRLNQRSGQVAEGRPKTPLIQNVESLLKVHFYIEANPIRAGLRKLENLQTYRFCSYKLYAYGIKDETNQHISIPQWYLELGGTDLQRQKKYRSLFRNYLDQSEGLDSVQFFRNFIGSLLWIQKQRERLSLIAQEKIHTQKTDQQNTS